MNEHKNLTHVVIEKFGKLVNKQNCSYDFFFIFLNYNIIIVQIKCINIETKEVVPIGYNRFLGLHHITYAEKEIRYIQYESLLLFHQYCILCLVGSNNHIYITRFPTNKTYTNKQM